MPEDDSNDGSAAQLAKYGVVGGGSALAGGAFSLSLFSQLGVAHLMDKASTSLAFVYAITAFCMIATVILGVGYFAVPNDRIQARARLFGLITFTFLAVFVTGFLIIGLGPKTIKVPIVMEDYRDKYRDYHHSDVGLVPYVEYPHEQDITDDDASRIPLSNESMIRVGIRHIDRLESSYDSRLSDLMILCSTPDLHLEYAPQCRNYRPTPQSSRMNATGPG